MAGKSMNQLSLFSDGALLYGRLHVAYSNRIEHLEELLARRIATFRATYGLFVPVTLLVPELSLQTYLEFRLAERLGIAANLDFRFLDEFLRSLVLRQDGACQPVQRPLVEGLLLKLFLDPAALEAEELSPLAAYLGAAGSSKRSRDRRAVQLARRLASLFTEYSVSRPEMLGQWVGASFVPSSPIEEWQSALHRRLFAPGGDLEQASEALGVRFVPMPRHVVDGLSTKDLAAALPPEIHLFCFSYLARGYQNVLARLATETDVHVYALNPCKEFWEDVPDRRPRRSLSRARLGGIEWLPESRTEDPFELGEDHESLALVLWGRPGREHIRMLNELSDCEFEPLWDESPGSSGTLLSLLQTEILERRDVGITSLSETDESLRVLACPGMRREVEAIAAEILRIAFSLKDDPGFRFNQIGVLMPADQLEAYEPHLEAAFSEFHGIPLNVTGLSRAGAANMAIAAQRLLDLPAGKFRRDEVLATVTHPAVLGRSPELRPEKVAAWCEALGILRGRSHDDLEKTYVEADVFSWDQGIRRLALGAFIDTAIAASDSRSAVPARPILPFPLAPSEIEPAGEFGLLLRSVLNDAAFLRGTSLPLDEWADVLCSYVSTYLVPQSDTEEQEIVNVLRAIRSIEAGAVPGLVTSYETARDLAAQGLGALSSGKGQHLARGVTIGSLMSLRALPFRVVFIAGLTGGAFPASEIRDALDLRARKRQPGDVTPRDRDLYLFLEALLSARERLVLSYSCQDLHTGDPLEPSPVIQELRFLLERKQPGIYGKRILHRVKAERSEELSDLSPETIRREAAAAQAGKEARSLLGGIGTLPSDLMESLEPPAKDKIRPLLEGPLVSLHVSSAEDSESPSAPPERKPSFSLHVLKRFLECPLQAVAESVAGLAREEESEEEQLRSDEAFDTDNLDALSLLRETFVEVHRREAGGGSGPQLSIVEAVYDQRAWKLEASGRRPTGVLGQAERDVHLRILAEWNVQTSAASLVSPLRLETLAFGKASEEARVDRAFDPLVFHDVTLAGGRIQTVELIGTVGPLVKNPAGTLVLSRVASESFNDNQRRFREVVRGFLDYAILVATGHLGPEGFHVFRIGAPSDGAGGKQENFSFGPWTQPQAHAYLATLLSEMLSGAHEDLFPIEAVAAHLLESPPPSFEESVANLLSSRSSSGCKWGPISDVASLPVPSDAEILRRIDARFGPFWSLVIPPPKVWK